MTVAYCQQCGGVLWGATMLSTAHPCRCQPDNPYISTVSPTAPVQGPPLGSRPNRKARRKAKKVQA